MIRIFSKPCGFMAYVLLDVGSSSQSVVALVSADTIFETLAGHHQMDEVFEV